MLSEVCHIEKIRLYQHNWKMISFFFLSGTLTRCAARVCSRTEATAKFCSRYVCVSLCEYMHACVSPLMCACHSDKEVCRGLHHLFRHIPHLNVSRRERRYEMLRSLWVWIKTGVCMHVCVWPCAPTCARMFKCAMIIHGMSPVYSVKWSSIETGEQVSPLPWQRADTSISRSLCSALLTCLSST